MKIIQVYSTLNIYLVLFVALLTDAKLQCEEVSKSLESNEPVEYNVAKKCLKSFPYNARHATKTVDSVLHFLSNYYVFLDRAKDNPPSGFKYQPVDLKTELISLRKTTFKSDHDFSMALRNTLFKLKDGHTRVTNLCYQNFIYDQNLALYSVITTDKVGKKNQVSNDTLDPSNNDCEVTEIGGKPALKAIVDFANDKIAYSKDLGVRFNMALALSINSYSQQFNLRGDFPETSNITYNLSCSKNKSFTLERKWNITYKNGFGLFNNFCLNQNNNTIFSPNDNFASSDKETESTLATESTSNDKFEPPESSNENKKLAHAKLVVEDFYLLDDGKTKVGVAVITRERQDHDNILKDGFQKLNKRDMSNNIGGALTVPLFLTSLLLSSKQPNSFPTDIIIQNFTIPKIEENFNTSDPNVYNIYNPNFYLSFPSGKHFRNASEFIGSRKKRTSNLYINALTSNEEKILNNISSFPWTSDDIIIITNGFCASSCALLTLFFSEIHKVKTIAVGGLLDTQMSFSTFPGGEVQSPNVISLFSESYDIDMNGTVKDILEYTYKPADYRLYYDEDNAKDPSLLWLEAAKILNEKA
ncbi:25572_t:CDS:2 [Gigaspora margarita]|uniref:25572_t:CDS:1 n=1 Tax=Gigaspora margarita TaxID=4874 RepID=A0ABN7UVK8_GIGMA|nr:25572_t:CDS:2 [Gigaspora margarita]